MKKDEIVMPIKIPPKGFLYGKNNTHRKNCILLVIRLSISMGNMNG